MSNITMRDIAKALGVSISTVSKAMSDSHEIGEETKQKIKNYAAQHQYFPNHFARTLKSGSSKSIGVIVSSIGIAVVAEMLEGIGSRCRELGYHPIVMQSKESHQQELECFELLKRYAVDGILIAPASESSSLKYLKELSSSGFPLVLFDRLSTEINVDKVSADNYKGGYLATEELINQGYDKIAYISIQSPFSITTERLNGYKQALTDNGIAFNSNYIRFCKYESIAELDEVLEGTISSLMQESDPPTAIFTASDQISKRCFSAFRKLNLKVPNDIALIGFTNTDMAEFTDPPMSVVYQPSFEIGKQAANLLIKQITSAERPATPTILKLPTELHVRESSLSRLNDK